MSFDKAIGLFDSGVGGLTVVRAIKEALPNENLVYLGDTARLPYGNKSSETIRRYSMENGDFLVSQDIKLLVIACNTASAYAAMPLHERYDVPVIGVIEPGAESAVRVTRNRRIGVIGTRGTVTSEAYQEAIKRKNPEAEVFTAPCPLFVPLVEEGFIGHQAARLIAEGYLKPLLDEGIDTLLLGCTHYPALRGVIQEVVGDGIVIVDSASACAAWVAAHLKTSGMLRPASPDRLHSYYVSDDPERFALLARSLLGETVTPRLLPQAAFGGCAI